MYYWNCFRRFGWCFRSYRHAFLLKNTNLFGQITICKSGICTFDNFWLQFYIVVLESLFLHFIYIPYSIWTFVSLFFLTFMSPLFPFSIGFFFSHSFTLKKNLFQFALESFLILLQSHFGFLPNFYFNKILIFGKF